MAQVIKIKRSAVAAKVPAISDLALGELAMNTTDGKLFMKKSLSGVESIVEIGGGTGGGGSGESNTASNLGTTGVGVFAQKTGVDLQFKKLVAGTNMTVIDNGNTVTLNSSGSSPANSTFYYGFTVKLNAGGTGVSSVTNLPDGWSASISTATLTVTHTVGRPPVTLTMYGTATATTGPFKITLATNSAAGGSFNVPDNGSMNPSDSVFVITTTATTGGSTGNGTVYVRVVF